MSELLQDFVERYLETLHPHRDPLLLEMEAQGRQQGIPIVSPQVGTFLHILARATGASRILELGTAIGYSTLWLVRALPPRGTMITVEWDGQRAAEADRYLERARVTHQVEIRQGSALDVATALEGPFDLIFNDIDKEGYPSILDPCVRLLGERGLLVSDNALFHGTVPRGDDTPAARAIREYNQLIRQHMALTSLVLPLGDGVAVSIKGGL